MLANNRADHVAEVLPGVLAVLARNLVLLLLLLVHLHVFAAAAVAVATVATVAHERVLRVARDRAVFPLGEAAPLFEDPLANLHLLLGEALVRVESAAVLVAHRKVQRLLAKEHASPQQAQFAKNLLVERARVVVLLPAFFASRVPGREGGDARVLAQLVPEVPRRVIAGWPLLPAMGPVPADEVHDVVEAATVDSLGKALEQVRLEAVDVLGNGVRFENRLCLTLVIGLWNHGKPLV